MVSLVLDVRLDHCYSFSVGLILLLSLQCETDVCYNSSCVHASVLALFGIDGNKLSVFFSDH